MVANELQPIDTIDRSIDDGIYYYLLFTIIVTTYVWLSHFYLFNVHVSILVDLD